MAPFISLFGLEIPSYTFMLLCGFAAGLFVAMRRTPIYGFRKDEVLASYFLAGIGAFFGGKLFSFSRACPSFSSNMRRPVCHFLNTSPKRDSSSTAA